MMRINWVYIVLGAALAVVGGVVLANGNWMDFKPTMKLFKMIGIAAGILTLPVFMAKSAGAKMYQRFFVWMTFFGVSVLFTILFLYAYLNFTTGEKHTYIADVSTIREKKTQRTGNSPFQCLHTAYWMSAVSKEYVTACASKAVFEDFLTGQKYRVQVTEEVYLKGLASKFRETSFIRQD